MIYLDNAATTFPKPECVYERVNDVQRTLAVNAGRGTYKAAQKASALIDEVRRKIALLVKCGNAENIVLSPSATIAFNQIIGGLEWSANMNVYVSPFEHNAVMRPLKSMSDKIGFCIQVLPFDESQKLDEIKMNNMFAIKHPDVVFVNHLSNVTGLILPVKQIFDSAKKYNAITISDVSQSLGLLDVQINSLNADFMVFAGHKNLYGHIGIGGFVSNGRIQLKKLLSGGTGSNSLELEMPDKTPDGFEPASHNIIAVAALDSAIDWLNETGIAGIYSQKKQLTEYAVQKLGDIKNIRLYLPYDLDSHIAVISLNHKDYRAEELAEILDGDFDIAVRSGFHCAPFVHDLIKTNDKLGTVRVSVGFFNSIADIDALISAIKEL